MLIQKLRLQHVWSQQQLAELSGLSTCTIQRLENGHTPSIESLKALAAVFEVDFNALRGAPSMPTSPPTQPQPSQPMPPSLTNPPHNAAYPTQQMNTQITDDEEKALRYVRELKKFYIQLLRYVLIIVALGCINLFIDASYLWFLWVAVIWGSFLAIKALTIFEIWAFLSPDWEKRQVEKRLGRKL